MIQTRNPKRIFLSCDDMQLVVRNLWKTAHSYFDQATVDAKRYGYSLLACCSDGLGTLLGIVSATGPAAPRPRRAGNGAAAGCAVGCPY